MKKIRKITKALTVLITVYCLLLATNCFSQGAAINTTGTAADASAGLDIQFNNKGLLIPRMTTAERNAIGSPANGLMIYNLDCFNFDYYNGTSWVAVNPIVASVSISANPGGAVCAGTSVTFTATPVNGGASPTYQWKLNGGDVGTNSATYTNSSLNNGDQISCELTSNAACVSGNPAVSNVLTMLVSASPTLADAGADQSLCNVTTTSLTANSPTVGTGLWSVVSGTATITTPSSPTSGVTALAVPGTATLRWTISNSPCPASTDDVVITTISCFTTCGVDNLVDSRDANSYQTVQIGTQCWMKENLKYLPIVHSNSEFATQATASQSGYGVYGYDGNNVTNAKSQANYTTYGVLYNWHAASGGTTSSANPSGVQGVCPSGWHLPSDAEWKQLEMELGMTQVQVDAPGWRGTDQGSKLKESGTTHWASPNTGATNSSGFTALPGGSRDAGGSFGGVGDYGYWWSATEDGSSAWRRGLDYSDATVYRGTGGKGRGYAVRCLRD